MLNIQHLHDDIFNVLFHLNWIKCISTNYASYSLGSLGVRNICVQEECAGGYHEEEETALCFSQVEV